MPWSWVNTECSIQQVQHHPKIIILPLPASFSSLGGCCTQLSTFPQVQANEWKESQLPSRLTPNRPPRSTPPILLDHSLEVHLQTRSISASKCISTVARLLPASLFPNWLNYGLQVGTSMASKCISKLAWSQPLSASLSSLNLSLQVHIQRYRGNGGGQSDGEDILGRPWSR